MYLEATEVFVVLFSSLPWGQQNLLEFPL